MKERLYTRKKSILSVYHVTCNGLTGRPVENYTGKACAIMLPFSFRVIRMNISRKEKKRKETTLDHLMRELRRRGIDYHNFRL